MYNLRASMTLTSKLTGNRGSGSVRILSTSYLCFSLHHLLHSLKSVCSCGCSEWTVVEAVGISLSKLLRAHEVEQIMKLDFHPGSLAYEFPIAALTNDHKLSGLKQQKCIILQPCRSEIQQGSHWAKIKLSSGLQFLSGASMEEPISLSFLDLRPLTFLALDSLPTSLKLAMSHLFHPSSSVITSLSECSQGRFSAFKNP